MKNYKYPDKGDTITCSFINSNSNEKYWSDSEKYVLSIMTEKILKLNTSPNFLDVGCGLGRLFSIFYPYVNSITALEPDFERFSYARTEGSKIDKNNIKVINNDLSCIGDEIFEVALISHIIQHLPFETTCAIFKKLGNIIPSGGLLFVTTTYTEKQNDVFTLESTNGSKHIAEIVSEEDFNKRFYDEGILPVRNFSYYTIDSLSSQNGFSIEKMFAYHFDLSLTDKIPTVEFDKDRNKERLYNGAKDVLYVLRKD